MIIYWINAKITIGLIASSFLFLLIFILMLYKICEFIELVVITKKLKLNYAKKEILLKQKVRNDIYRSYDKHQKDWITKFCKKNKLNNIEKLKILREEISKKQTVIKYIDLAVIGALLIVVWEILLQYMTEEFGMWSAFLIASFFAIIVSIAIGIAKKEWKEHTEYMNLFDNYMGYERLQQLLVYRMVKVGR